MSADFSHLRKLSVDKAKTIEYEIVELEGNPVLYGVFAGETNRGYYNELIKRSTRNARRFRAKKLSTKELKQHRDEDRELFPVHVLTGWSGVTDARGQPVEFSQSNCESFLDALPDWIFDDVRGFFSNPQSFVDEEMIEDDDVEELGNSLATD